MDKRHIYDDGYRIFLQRVQKPVFYLKKFRVDSSSNGTDETRTSMVLKELMSSLEQDLTFTILRCEKYR